jgi:hypothetical protein
MERDFNKLNLRQVYAFVYTTFQIPPPVHIWGNFDPAEITFEDGKMEVDPTPYFEYALSVRHLKGVDLVQYRHHLHTLLTQGVPNSGPG